VRGREAKPADKSVLFKEGETWRQSKEFLRDVLEECAQLDHCV